MTFEPGMEGHLQTFSRICYSPWYTRIRTRTLRPERPEYSIIMGSQGENASNKRQTVVRLLYNSLAGGTSYRSLLPLAQNRRIITGLTAILFDQECCCSANFSRFLTSTVDPAPWSSLIASPLSFLSWSGQSGARMVASLIEHMLLIDYGFGEHPLRSLGPEPSWMTNYMTRVVCHDFCRRLTRLADDCRNGKDIWYCRLAWMDEFIQSYEDKSSAYDDFSDVSLMFYLFWTRRHNISKSDYYRGLTGYEGVLPEMVAEVPTMGTDRLTRKLSVDVHKLIPRYVKDEESRTAMIAVAKRLAMRNRVVLEAPESALEYLTRESVYNVGRTRRNLITTPGSNSARSYDTAIEREPTPPPSYEEAIGRDVRDVLG